MRVGVSKLSSYITLPSFIGLGVALSLGVALQTADAQTVPTAVDTQSLRLAGARGQGALLTPSGKLLDAKAWDFSLTYGFEHAVLRSEVLTGEVRGQNKRETINWLNNRHTAYAQFAIAPSERVELVVGVPLLISQSAQAGTIIDPAPSGSAALGDMRMLARVGVFNETKAPLSWNLEAGAILPSGNQDLLFGEQKVRYIVGTSLGVPLSSKIRVDVRLAHENAQMATIGNQILGDTLIAQAALSHEPIEKLRWFVELSSINVISASPPGANAKRNALELDAGARVQFEHVYLDGGVGYGALDAGYTPQVRALFSIGTTGQIGGKNKRNKDESCNELCPATLDQLRTLVHDATVSVKTGATTCVMPPEDYTGAIDEQGCIDFNNPQAAQEFQQRSLEETKVYFELNKAELTPAGEDTVRHVALILMHNEGDIHIIGHADDQGNDELNNQLSLDRAATVERALVAAGVEAARLDVDAKGSALPISPDTDFGRSINRRVDFVWAE